MSEAPVERKVALVSIYGTKSAYDCRVHDTELGFLYMMLAQRDPVANISHRKMPTWEEHCQFVNSNPYKHWWVLLPAEKERPDGKMPWIGNAYVTFQNEVGLFLLDEYQRVGYGSAVMDAIETEMDPVELLANVAPDNHVSQKFFQSRGYREISRTYRLERRR